MCTENGNSFHLNPHLSVFHLLTISWCAEECKERSCKDPASSAGLPCFRAVHCRWYPSTCLVLGVIPSIERKNKNKIKQTNKIGKDLIWFRWICQTTKKKTNTKLIQMERDNTVIEVEWLGWEGTCNWLDGTDRSFLFLSGVLSVTEICGAEPSWVAIPDSCPNMSHVE